MANSYSFTGAAGQTMERKLYMVFGNYGTAAAPQWGVLGKRVEDSSAEMDWGDETKQDILGETYSTMKKPTITQTFDPCELDSGDEYQQHIWELAVVEQNAAALSSQDMLRVHLYAVDSSGKAFAERYHSCMVKPTGLGGEGGGALTQPVDVTFGGKRETGTAVVGSDGSVTFTPDTEEA